MSIIELYRRWEARREDYLDLIGCEMERLAGGKLSLVKVITVCTDGGRHCAVISTSFVTTKELLYRLTTSLF